MTDILDPGCESDLTEEEQNRLLLMCGHAVAPPLSPAAKAVLDAAYALPLKNGQPNIAAALRAAVEQVVPPPRLPHDSCCDVHAAAIRAGFLAIADELKAL